MHPRARLVVAIAAFHVGCSASGPDEDPDGGGGAAVPGPARAVTATGGLREISAVWEPPDSDGGSAITGYVVTVSPGMATVRVAADQHRASVTGLANGTAYVVSVVAANRIGAGPAATASAATWDVPGAPTSPVVVAARGRITVSWSPPTSDGGSPVTGYTVTPSSGTAATVDGGTLSATFTALPPGPDTTFRIAASSLVGTGPAAATQAVAWRRCDANITAVDLFGGRREDQASALAREPASGDVYVGGEVRDRAVLGATTVTTSGALGGFVSRKGRAGAMIWTTALTGDDDVHVNAIAVLAGGDVAVAGDFKQTLRAGGTTLVSAGGADIFVARLRGSDGGVLWAKRFGAAYEDTGLGIAVGSGDAVFVTGAFYAAVAFGGKTLAAKRYDDAFVVRLRGTDGAVDWAVSGGGFGYDAGRALAVDGADRVWMAGVLDGSDFTFGGQTPSPPPHGSTDVLVVSLSATTGAVHSVAALGGVNLDGAYALALGANGDVVVAGRNLEHPDFGAGPEDVFWGAFVADLEASGALRWVRFLEGDLDTVVRSLDIAANGDILFTGTAKPGWRVGSATPPSNGMRDIVAGRLTSTGTVVALASLGGPDEDAGTAVLGDGAAGLLIAGSVTGWMDSCEAAPLATAGAGDAALLALDFAPLAGPPVLPPQPLPIGASLCVPRAPAVPSPLPAVAAPPTFGRALPYTPPDARSGVYPVPLDLDGDGREEVALAYFDYQAEGLPTYGGQIHVLQNDGQGNLTAAPSAVLGHPIVDAPRRFDRGDFDHDGRADAYFAGAGWDENPGLGARAVLLVQDGAGHLIDESPSSLPTGTRVFLSDYTSYDHASAVADVDCDGYSDVVALPFNTSNGYGPRPQLLRNDRSGHLIPEPEALPATFREIYSLNGSPFTAAALCDVDLDGAPDLVAGPTRPDDTRGYLLLNDGRGRFTDAGDVLPPHHLRGATTYDFACADFDLDGWPDLVDLDTSNASLPASLELWHNDHDGTFSDVTGSAVPRPLADAQFIFARDFNGDGWMDLLVDNNDSAAGCKGSQIYSNDGRGGFTVQTLAGTTHCEHVVPIEANGDGKLDLLLVPQNNGSGIAAVWVNTSP